MATRLQFGLLLPHFGEYASVEQTIRGAKLAETYGFDSVWVRDHLVFEPYDIEGSDNSHIEGLLMLAAVAPVTTKLTLGTAMLICHRNPVHLAQSFAALSALSHGRLIMGMGLGGFPHEFAAAGLPSTLQHRARLARVNATICRQLWTGHRVTYKDDTFQFANVRLKPTPVSDIPIWTGGGTPAACRRAVEYCDGWMPARITLATFKQRMAYLRALSETAGRPMITTAVMPLTSIAKDKTAALKEVKLQSLLTAANTQSTWARPASGSFSTFEDIRGLILAGTPEDIVRETGAYQQLGIDHIVYDLRFRYGAWLEQIDLLGQEVLPVLKD